MLICPECNNQNVPVDAEYCPQCGCPIEYIKENQPSEGSSLKCPECGAMVSFSYEYCPSCGCPIEYIRENQDNVAENSIDILICPECGEKVKSDCDHCPECGCPMEYIQTHQGIREVNTIEVVEQYSASTDSAVLVQAAQDDNVDAMYWLGYCYYYGENDFEEDEDEAEKWIKKAASLGHLKAKEDLVDWFDSECDDSDDYVIRDINAEYPLKKLFARYDSIVFVDTETSGLDSQNNRVIELSAIKLVVKNGQIIVADEMDEFVQLPSGVHLDRKITELTGITEQQLMREGKPSYDVFSRFVSMIENEKTLFVAYNAQFDISFVYWTLHREGLLDHMKIFDKLDALTIFKDRHEYPHKLENAIDAYGLSGRVSNTHRAIDDTRALLEVVKAMDEECDDLDKYINLFGYHPKYGVNGRRLASVTYVAQPYNNYKKLYE